MATKFFTTPDTDIKEGLITHADQEKDGLSFALVDTPDGPLLSVAGTDAAIAAWQERTKLSELTGNEYQTRRDAYELAGLTAQKKRLEEELQKVNTRIAELS